MLNGINTKRWIVIITRCAEVDNMLDDEIGPLKAENIVSEWYRKSQFPNSFELPNKIYRYEKNE